MDQMLILLVDYMTLCASLNDLARLVTLRPRPNGVDIKFADGFFTTVPWADLAAPSGDRAVGVKLITPTMAKVRFASGKELGADAVLFRRLADPMYRAEFERMGEFFEVSAGRAFTHRRVQLGITMDGLATRAGTTAERVAEVERGALVRVRELCALLEPLSMQIDDLCRMEQELTGQLVIRAVPSCGPKGAL